MSRYVKIPLLIFGFRWSSCFVLDLNVPSDACIVRSLHISLGFLWLSKSHPRHPGSPWKCQLDSAVGSGDACEALPSPRSSTADCEMMWYVEAWISGILPRLGFRGNLKKKTYHILSYLFIFHINIESCLNMFEYVWMDLNGQKHSKTMSCEISQVDFPPKPVTESPKRQASHRPGEGLHEAWLPTATRKIGMTSG